MSLARWPCLPTPCLPTLRRQLLALVFLALLPALLSGLVATWLAVAGHRAAAAGQGPLLAWGLGALGALLCGGLLAAAMARRIREPLDRLLAQARALSARPDPEAAAAEGQRLGLAELETLRLALAEAAAALRARLAAEAAAHRAAQEAARLAAALEREVAERDTALAQAAEARRTALRRHEAAQAALLQAQKLQALGELAGRVAHEFNGALATIIGGYRLLQRQTTDPALQQVMRDGDRAAERAASLVRQLVEFARREELRPTETELPTLLAEVQEMIRYTVGKGLAVAVELPPGLWPVLVDPHRLEVALLNLAAHARDGLPPGGSLLITARNLSAEQRPARLRATDYVAIALHDAGQGGADDAGRRGRAGLGLAMVQRFAEQSGGSWRIDRRPDGCTTMEILLPRAEPEAAALVETAEVLDPRLHGGATILLVDTEEDARARQAAMLRDLGYTVAEAGHAEAAESLAHWLASLDLLITAMELPGVDGAALAARLRADRPDLPVLFLTAAPPGPALAGESALRRPVAEADLAGLLLDLLQRRRSLHAPPPGMRLLRRLRTPLLRAAYLAWHAARLPGEALPRRACLDLAGLGLQENCALVAIDRTAAEPGFHFVSVGRALTDRLGHGLDGTPIALTGETMEVPGTLQGAYRRAARTQAPVFESADFDFGEGPRLRFERVTLPVSEDGEAVTHLVGVVLFHETAVPGTTQAVPAR